MSFATLFLGLVLGTHPVQILVTDPSIVRVEVRLDGDVVGAATEDPWVVEVPFGDRLTPHELEAAAFDSEGNELTRIDQRINVPRPLADVAVALEKDEKGRVVGARFQLESVDAEPVKEVSVRVDGREVQVDDVSFVPFPALDAEVPHVLEAELVFQSGILRHVDATFGGRFSDEVDTAITAFPVSMEDRRSPDLDRLSSWLEVDGEPAAVAGLDDTLANVVFVREPEARTALYLLEQRHLRATTTARRRAPGFNRAVPQEANLQLRDELALAEDVRIRVLGTEGDPRAGARHTYDVFRPSAELTREHGGVLWILSRLEQESSVFTERHTAAAVATAGLVAARDNRRRAVVLVSDGFPSTDSDAFSPALVRCFLRDLRVPLFVWSVNPDRKEESAWGETTRIVNLSDLRRATNELSRELDRQRMVWIEGSHLPQRIRLSERAEGVSLAGPSCRL